MMALGQFSEPPSEEDRHVFTELSTNPLLLKQNTLSKFIETHPNQQTASLHKHKTIVVYVITNYSSSIAQSIFYSTTQCSRMV